MLVEKDWWYKPFSLLTDAEKMTVIQVGIEMIWRMNDE
jgi:hypothetical protein